MELSIWISQFGTLNLDLSIWISQFGTLNLDSWTLDLELSIWNSWTTQILEHELQCAQALLAAELERAEHRQVCQVLTRGRFCAYGALAIIAPPCRSRSP